MSDHVNAFTVVLDEDIREDDVRQITTAIMQIRHVISVDANVADITAHMAESRAKFELSKKLMDIVR